MHVQYIHVQCDSLRDWNVCVCVCVCVCVICIYAYIPVQVTEDKVKSYMEQEDYIPALRELILPSKRLLGGKEREERNLSSEALRVAALHNHFGHKLVRLYTQCICVDACMIVCAKAYIYGHILCCHDNDGFLIFEYTPHQNSTEHIIT